MPICFKLGYSFWQKPLGICVFIAICYQLNVFSKMSSIVPNNSDIPKTRAVICSIQVKEDAYIDEWVDYHLAIGFRKIYIYDNSKNFDLKAWGQRRLSDNVKVKHFPGKKKQPAAFSDCSKWAEKDGETWAAFFDIDEFLHLKNHDSIDDFLIEHGPPKGAIAINWLEVGTSNATKYEPKPVTLRFPHTIPQYEKNIRIKTIARVAGLDKFLSPHSARFIDNDTITIDTHGDCVSGDANLKKRMDVAVLYHYHFKSREEYVAKRKRGRGTNGMKEYKELLNQAKYGPLPAGDTFDDSVWRILKHRVPKYALFEDIK